jgi:hypothetical protein
LPPFSPPRRPERDGSRIFARIAWALIGLILDLTGGDIDDQLGSWFGSRGRFFLDRSCMNDNMAWPW